MELTDLNRPRSTPISHRGLDFESIPQQEEARCLHQLFEAEVDRNPQAIAIVHEDETLTYQQLDFRANQIARALRFYGAGPGKLVGLYFERSSLPIVAILGTLKAGSAYVPIDPVYPQDRIRHIFSESEMEILLTENALAEKANELFSGSILSLDAGLEEIEKQPVWRVPVKETGVTETDLCYVIYTSGTTGRPKGVMTEHGNAVKFVHAFNEVCTTTKEDRIYQGFSLGFDGSVEEIWMAFSNGASLVVPSRHTARFGNDVAEFLTKAGVTYFSTVPTLLSTISDDIKSLKQLVVSGEICPPELVARWARPGRKMLNVYGPTECTVNTTAAECLPGQPITIGKPLNGYRTYVLDSDLRPVAPGEKGELYIAGETLCRGYLKQPTLTAEKFTASPFLSDREPGRLYRTGDLVRFNPDGELEFFGRMDTQVKIRGFRVELGEIEAVLLEYPNVRWAAVKLFEKEGLQELAAYVVLANRSTALDRDVVLAKLQSKMPHYMIPGFLDVLDELPTLTSGKVDRSRLPEPIAPLVRNVTNIVSPATELEAKIAKVWGATFSLPRVSVEADFFLDLGGHSLVAAQMVTRLRTDAGLDVNVRDAYRYPTVRKLADFLSLRKVTKVATARKIPTETSKTVFESLPRWVRYTTGCLQAVSLYIMYGMGAIPYGLFLLLAVAWYQGQFSHLVAFGLFFLLGVATWIVLLTISIAAKWILIGRYKPGKYPLWGFFYLRWWLASRLQLMSGFAIFAGTPILNLYYRLMGAKVGKNCTLDTAQCVAWDLVSIGDETSIGADTQLLGYRVENGMLVLGNVDIGSRCFVGLHCAMGLNVRMEDDSRLDDQSMLPDGGTIAKALGMRGSPCQPAEVKIPAPDPNLVRRPIRYGIYHFLLGYPMVVAFFLPSLAFISLIVYAFVGFGRAWGFASLIVSVPLLVPFSCIYIAGLKRLILNSSKPGVYSLYSPYYLRKWLADGIVRMARTTFLPVYTTIYLPPWLRLMGAKIGKHAELSTVWYCSPEMLEIGDGSFFADGCIVGGKRIFRGQFEVGPNSIGSRSFVGNGAVVPMGGGLGEGCLLGVLSTPPEGAKKIDNKTEWLGSPSFRLPHRPKIAYFDDTVTYRPTPKLYAQRAVIDALRILIPGYIALGIFVAGIFLLAWTYLKLGVVATLALSPLYLMAFAFIAASIVVAIKWLVMGRFRPVIKPLWSMYVWLNEMVNGAFESVMAPAISPLLGTPFIAPWFRAIGCKVGKHTFIESTLVSEFDLVEIGDYAALNPGSIIQTHLFEDRVMKSSYLKIGPECSVGNMAAILYDTEMQQGASLGPLSLLMKGEVLSAHGKWHGIPNSRIGE